jgi:precorrin-6A/cobalt-precorrin-6A reductase
MPADRTTHREKILILGGTAEARLLADRLVAEGHAVTTSLAGRTLDPVMPAGATRIGGFGGPEGLAAYLRAECFDRLIDATHPFARRISENAIQAAAITGIPLEHCLRPRWQKQPGDRWVSVASLEAAANVLPSAAIVFLALGRQYLDAFTRRDDCRFIIRMVDAPATPLPFRDHVVVLGKPASDAEQEANLFTAYGVTNVVCRNSGGPAGYAKIIAARRLALPVVMIERD